MKIYRSLTTLLLLSTLFSAACLAARLPAPVIQFAGFMVVMVALAVTARVATLRGWSPRHLLILMAGLFGGCAISGCAQPGQPPNLANQIVGIGVIAGDNFLITQASSRIESAYAAGKIDFTTYNILRGEEQAAYTAFDNLGVSILNNTPVTQDQVSAAEQTLLTPLLSDLTKYLGPPAIPTTQPAK